MIIQTLHRWVLRAGRRLPARVKRIILEWGGRTAYARLLAAVSRIPAEADERWQPLYAGCSVLTPILRKQGGVGRYLEVTLGLTLDWKQARRYEHGTLGIEFGDSEALGASVIATFRLDRVDRLETVRVRMPPEVEAAQYARIRLLPAPHCDEGQYRFTRAKFVDDPAGTDPLTRIAELEALKERTRIRAAQAQTDSPEICDHYPVALTFELTAACNLTCAHCSSHGDSGLHRFNNKLDELTVEKLEALAHEVFPSLSVISLVGRGEPLVLKEPLWQRFVELVTKYRVKLAITTNGYFLERRITPELLPLIDTINLSMDGVTPETFARNRGGADIERVWRNVGYYHDLRRSSGLARAPRLAFAWTLKRNNIAELPDFVRKIATFDADVLTARHMIIFFSAEKDQSLLLMPPAEVNQHLIAAYDFLQEFGIQRDCVPLFSEPVDEAPVIAEEPATEAVTAPIALVSEPCMFIHSMPVIMAGGEVMACAVPHAAKAGNLGGTATFGEIWNGETLRDIRRTLNTEAEWPQCRTCSYREARVTSQRNLAAAGERYESEQKAVFSEESLNFAKPGA